MSGIIDTLAKKMVRPLVSRVGTALAVFLVSSGIDSPLVEQFVNAVVAAALIGVDVLLDAYYRKRAVNEAVAEVASVPRVLAGLGVDRQSGEIYSNE